MNGPISVEFEVHGSTSEALVTEAEAKLEQFAPNGEGMIKHIHVTPFLESGGGEVIVWRGEVSAVAFVNNEEDA